MMKTKLETLKEIGEAPHWLEESGFSTLSAGYLLPGETPKLMYRRVASASAARLNRPDMEEKFFNLIWKNWLCLATPVAANMGTKRGLPISCYAGHIGDSIADIFDGMKEIAMLSKHGGGIGSFWGDVRPRGSAIQGNGMSDGIIPFLKILDSTTIGVSQGGTRRGAASSYLPIEHADFYEFLNMRRAHGDVNRQCLNIHHGVTITDAFMKKVMKGDKEARNRWTALLKTRFETGEPYILFVDKANRLKPECYVKNNLSVSTSNLCSEILLHTDIMHTFVCCLSSMNLARWEEWRNTDAVYDCIWFLDGVMQEFIDKTADMEGFERAHRFAVKSRALGLGVLGFHSLIQELGYGLDSMETYLLNNAIFSTMRKETERATKDLAIAYGEPEWCQGFERRNSHTMACAPTVSNSTISGNLSAGIEPLAANAYAKKTAKGVFLEKNKTLEKILIGLEKNTDDVWNSIVVSDGSVQHLSFLTKEQKEVFLTARELNQFTLIKLASARQRWVDQGQSLNVFFPANTDVKYYNQVHIEAWKSGLELDDDFNVISQKGGVLTLYYTRTSSVLKGDAGTKEYKREGTTEATVMAAPVSHTIEECLACQG